MGCLLLMCVFHSMSLVQVSVFILLFCKKTTNYVIRSQTSQRAEAYLTSTDDGMQGQYAIQLSETSVCLNKIKTKHDSDYYRNSSPNSGKKLNKIKDISLKAISVR